uniref:Uncharacterized protein LOC100176663 n=1 Tax=Phallusia mammillata TaxID=59560 RepID=A0A6F9DGR7_9ASCI|nr:uncharacterized protein LOC100176663 [Phallusia mammillata]
MAHAMFHSGCTNDAETKLKKMLQENPQAVDVHVVKLHLGLMKIFTKRIDEGMTALIEVLSKKGERVVSSLLRDIPISERAHLADESHQFGIDVLQRSRDADAVKQAVGCFTIAILSCRGTDLVLEGLNGGTGVYRSYLARAECMAHTGDQRAAILDFSAAIEVNSSCVEGLCGRAFMRLALGDETDCVNDVTLASDIDLYTVVSQIHVLPQEARKLLLFWIDHRVVVLLLNYGYKATSGERISTGGSASTISMIDETAGKPGHDTSRRSSLSSIHPPSTASIREETQEELLRESNGSNTPRKDDVTPTANNVPGDVVATEGAVVAKSDLHKSESSTRDLKEALLSLDAAYDSQLKQRQQHRQMQNSRGSTATTVTSVSTYDDVISAMEKAEILHKAMVLGRLLISVDDTNVTWHGMYADILIVKGDFDEALRHLHVVMELNPNDVTAVARAGLINVKMNRYHVASTLLRSLCRVDRSGLVYVLKALDPTRRRKLADESLNHAEEFSREGKYSEARDAYSLSLLADASFKTDKLRKRSKCNAKVGDTAKAIVDITEVIKETTKRPLAIDYCSRASIYLMEGKEFQACRDYAAAIDIDRDQALTLVHVKPGRASLCEIFYRQAMESYERHNFQECHDLCEVALSVDDNDIPMRKLRARAKREISKCVVQ